jgi:hypothetical protein
MNHSPYDVTRATINMTMVAGIPPSPVMHIAIPIVVKNTVQNEKKKNITHH